MHIGVVVLFGGFVPKWVGKNNANPTNLEFQMCRSLQPVSWSFSLTGQR